MRYPPPPVAAPVRRIVAPGMTLTTFTVIGGWFGLVLILGGLLTWLNHLPYDH